MSQSETTRARKNSRTSVLKMIEEQKQQMIESGKCYFICAICGKRGPLIATKDCKTGEMVIDFAKADKWPIKVVAAEGNSATKIISTPGSNGMTVGSTTIRICPGCSRKNH